MTRDMYLSWGSSLREQRVAARLTQAQLAEKAGSTKSHVSNIERGLTSVSDGLRMRLAAALDTTAADLFPYPDAVPA